MKNVTRLNIETCTFSGDSGIPGISGYGTVVNIEIESELLAENPIQTTTIRIGDFLFLPETLLRLVNECNNHNSRLINKE